MSMVSKIIYDVIIHAGNSKVKEKINPRRIRLWKWELVNSVNTG